LIAKIRIACVLRPMPYFGGTGATRTPVRNMSRLDVAKATWDDAHAKDSLAELEHCASIWKLTADAERSA
jgi:hypothetical protein